ncbi:hypothetical protein SCALM49S_05217 [Streptomyces californicus]
MPARTPQQADERRGGRGPQQVRGDLEGGRRVERTEADPLGAPGGADHQRLGAPGARARAACHQLDQRPVAVRGVPPEKRDLARLVREEVRVVQDDQPGAVGRAEPVAGARDVAEPPRQGRALVEEPGPAAAGRPLDRHEDAAALGAELQGPPRAGQFLLTSAQRQVRRVRGEQRDPLGGRGDEPGPAVAPVIGQRPFGRASRAAARAPGPARPESGGAGAGSTGNGKRLSSGPVIRVVSRAIDDHRGEQPAVQRSQAQPDVEHDEFGESARVEQNAQHGGLTASRAGEPAAPRAPRNSPAHATATVARTMTSP